MKIDVKKQAGDVVIFMDGELDESVAREIRDEMDYIIDHNQFNNIVVDFSKLHFMDSTGIGVLLGRFKKLRAQGKDLLIRNPNKQIDKILAASGMYKVFQLV